MPVIRGRFGAEACSCAVTSVTAQTYVNNNMLANRAFISLCLDSLTLKFEYADVAEARLARRAPRALAPVNLQPDVAFARVTLAVVFKVGQLHVVEPGGDMRGLAFDLRSQFVPGVLLKILLPVLVLLDESALGRSVEAADEAVLAVINRDLIAHSVVANAKEQPGVDRIIGFKLQLDLIIGVFLFGAEQPALEVFLLIGHERALFDRPYAAVAAVDRHQSPAIEALSVKQLLPYLRCASGHRGRGYDKEGCDNFSSRHNDSHKGLPGAITATI